jgi:hypothetical protein
MAPQSGQVHWIPLQVMPHRFSCMQSEQIIKPQGQVQQKVCSREQAAQIYFSGLRHFPVRRSFSGPSILVFF